MDLSKRFEYMWDGKKLITFIIQNTDDNVDIVEKSSKDGVEIIVKIKIKKR
mgnify:CR=1 FL=1